MKNNVLETITGFESSDKVIVGVVADTHVPDRVNSLHPRLLDVLKEASVDLILHAGDICSQEPIDQLETVAPVYSVSGNRDILFAGRLPTARVFCLAGHKVAMTHGNGRLRHYFLNKLKMVVMGYHLDIFMEAITEPVPDAEITIFGHTHRAVNIWYNGTRLLFNPGSCSLVPAPDGLPSIGLLYLVLGEQAKGEIVALEGARLKNRRWELNQLIS